MAGLEVEPLSLGSFQPADIVNSDASLYVYVCVYASFGGVYIRV